MLRVLKIIILCSTVGVKSSGTFFFSIQLMIFNLDLLKMVGFFFVSLFSVHECVSGSLVAVCLGFCCHREYCFVVAWAFWAGRGGCALEKSWATPELPLCLLATALPLLCVGTEVCRAPGGLNCGTDVTMIISNVMTTNSNSSLNFNPAISCF